MHSTYSYPEYAYRKPPEIDATTTRHRPVVIVGAGPVGLTAALDLGLRGVPVIVLDDDSTVSLGSRGVAYAKRTLEILDRLGVGDRIVAKGVRWNVGRTFFRNEEVYNFELVPDPEHKHPGMVNLQQYYLEQFLVERAGEIDAIDLRWKNKVVGVKRTDSLVTLSVETPDGPYSIQTDWLIVGDGARSPIRHMLGLEATGKVFQDRFLIVDVVMKAEFPAERWFWFDPPFYPGQSVLLHKQADNVWRIDFQLGWDADPEAESKPEKVIPRIKAMLGEDRVFELEWISVYTFRCRRLERFRHGRIVFVGDSAHQLSPFGGRGANSGMQDADNLGWKLKLVLDGLAPPELIDSYSTERVVAADENLMNSTRSTDFITPKSRASRLLQTAVLHLARHHPFARQLVNSGRLSAATFLTTSPLNTPDESAFEGRMIPGAAIDDGPVEEDGVAGWLVDRIPNRFTLLYFVDAPDRIAADTIRSLEALASGGVAVGALMITRQRGVDLQGQAWLFDVKGIVATRFDARDQTTYLIRPDLHVAARWRSFDPDKIGNALKRATCNRSREPHHDLERATEFS